MNFFGGLFWGIFLLASGLIILLKLSLNLRLSTGKMIVGVFILLMGISLLTSNFGWRNFNINGDNTVSFTSDQQVSTENNKQYLVLFGSSTYDLTKLEPGQSTQIRCIFGSCNVRLPATAVQVNASSVFGSIHLPDGSNVPFGSGSYSTDGDNKVQVDVTCIFGSSSITS